jgi:hypothetical protein
MREYSLTRPGSALSWQKPTGKPHSASSAVQIKKADKIVPSGGPSGKQSYAARHSNWR